MAFARAVGEIGAIVLIAGNLPFKTEVASVFLFHGSHRDPEGSAAVAVVLLLVSFTVLLGIGGLRWFVDEARPWVGSRSASPRSATCADPGRAARDDGVAHARDSTPPGTAITDPDTIAAFKLTLMVTAIAVAVNTVFGIVCALLIVRGKIPGRGFLNAFVDLPLSLSPVIVGLRARHAVRGPGLARLVPAERPRDPLRDAVDRARDDLRHAAVRRARGGPDPARDRHRAGAGRADARGVGLADVLARHAAGDPVGCHLRRRPHGGPRASASSARSRSCPGTSRVRRRRRRFGSRTRTSSPTATTPPPTASPSSSRRRLSSFSSP